MRGQEFWHESLTEQSFLRLQELSKEIDLCVIGGWSVWLWTRQHKSRDIDILVDFGGLAKLKEKYALEKNDRLKKYEIKLGGFDVDIYVPFYSRLAIPIEAILEEKVKIDGINTVSAEALLILKQGAEIARRGTVKGQKDSIDIISLLIYAPISIRKYFELLGRFGKEKYAKELLAAISGFNPADSGRYLGMKYPEFSKKKKELIGKIKDGYRKL